MPEHAYGPKCAHCRQPMPSRAQDKGGNWLFGEPTDGLLADAFAIGDGKHCSVFHVFDHDNTSLQVIEALNPDLPLASVPATLVVNVLHIRTDLMGRTTEARTIEPMPPFRTAFLRIDKCQMRPPAPMRVSTAAP